MAILENLENSWELDPEQIADWCKTGSPEFESNPIIETDAMGRQKIWGNENYPNLSVKIFSETCCTDCRCKDE